MPSVAYAIQAGFRAARGDVIVTTMANLSDPPEVIVRMAEKVRREGAAVVSGSRYMTGGSQTGGPYVKRMLSRFAGLSLSWVAGLPTHDATTNFRAYSRDFLAQVRIESRHGFEVGLELTVKAHLQGLRAVTRVARSEGIVNNPEEPDCERDQMKTIFESRPTYNDRGGRKPESFLDLEDEHDFWRLYEIASPFSLLAVQGFFNLYSSIKYIAERNIPGDIVESGVFLGGASIFAALARDHFGVVDRKVYMFDTFAGFPKGTTDHVKGRGVVSAGKMAPFRIDVEENIRHCGVRPGSYELIEGPVEETLRTARLPTQISLLRLDTDFYPSTKAEFEYLYPRLVTGGVLIVDDYGLWDGSRRATDEALAKCPIMLHRIDATIRSAIKI